MPSPKDGTPGNLVAPAAPTEALDADKADPGQVETVKAGDRQTQTGKYSPVNVKPFKKPDDDASGTTAPGDPAGDALAGDGSVQPGSDPPVKKLSWIEIVLVDANDKPVAGEAYKITLPDSSVKEGTLDDQGFARVDGCDPGTCQVTFPMMDGRSWKKV